jgi:MarR family transcriptional regulator for hemolysin
LRVVRPDGIPIGRRLALTSKTVSAAFNAALAAEGGSQPTWLILSALRSDRWSTQLDLARSLGIEGPTLTRHLENLERSGFVRRERSETDRRALRVELTEAGETAHGRMLGAVVAFDQQLRSGLSSEDLVYLEHVLAKLDANVRPSALPRLL